MIGTLELGLIFGVVALGVYLTFKVLNFPDLTVDGSFTTGAATAGILITAGINPFLATLAGFGAGLIAGAITGVLHTYLKIDGLLAGILSMIALWSINLRIMGSPNLPLTRVDTVFTPLRDGALADLGLRLGSWGGVFVLAVVAIALKLVIDWFLSTNLGLAVQATGDNEPMIRSFGVNTNATKILTLALSNGLVALAGAMLAQYQNFADMSMGVGMILIGLASVILGQAVIGQSRIWQATLAVVVGAVLYRVIIFFALAVGLNPNDMRLITALLVLAALVLPRIGIFKNLRIPRLNSKGKLIPADGGTR
ncbi:ABC transporter permease [Canibacter zhoujuaniae]|uniref:ABC transporter permease n=1 Tax=Canibacter zhoujuaniae TaxID=2708343 RepID=UPI00141E303B|nr:ABC transporter permease [Canibacter zhoujuaniae]